MDLLPKLELFILLLPSISNGQNIEPHKKKAISKLKKEISDSSLAQLRIVKNEEIIEKSIKGYDSFYKKENLYVSKGNADKNTIKKHSICLGVLMAFSTPSEQSSYRHMQAYRAHLQ